MSKDVDKEYNNISVDSLVNFLKKSINVDISPIIPNELHNFKITQFKIKSNENIINNILLNLI